MNCAEVSNGGKIRSEAAIPVRMQIKRQKMGENEFARAYRARRTVRRSETKD
jgi:hypothetical protein